MDNGAPVTVVYFVRHAESDRTVRDGRIRPLTDKGVKDAQKLPALFTGVRIDRIYSSPFKRAADTVRPVAAKLGQAIELIEGFRERRSDSVQTMPMDELLIKQWRDFTYTLSDGECLRDVQRRNIEALRGVLAVNAGKTVLIGTHGVALCTILKYYNETMSEAEFEHIMPTMPYVARVEFEGERCIGIHEIGAGHV